MKYLLSVCIELNLFELRDRRDSEKRAKNLTKVRFDGNSALIKHAPRVLIKVIWLATPTQGGQEVRRSVSTSISNRSPHPHVYTLAKLYSLRCLTKRTKLANRWNRTDN